MTVSEAAARLGKSERQIRYMIRQGKLRAKRPGKAWLIDLADVPAGGLSEGQTAARERVAARIDAEATKVSGDAHVDGRRRYSLTDMKAYQIAQPLLARCVTELDAGHAATALLRCSLEHLGTGCHWFERDLKSAAYHDARDAASRAVVALYLDGAPAARARGA